MRVKTSIQNLFPNLIFLTLLVFVSHVLAAAPRWEKLGEKSVSDRLDRDVIVVTWKDGAFDAIRLDVDGGAVTIYKCEIHFEKGGTQEVELRHTFRGSLGSRVIDLEGNKRLIEKIVLVYDGKTRLRKNATVSVYGRH